MLAALFSLMILFICILKPDMGGDRISATWRERFLALIDLIPPAILFLGVIGTIYAGFATPTEAASIGVVLSLILAAWKRKLTAKMLLEAFEGTVRTTSMIMLIIFAAMILNIVVGFFRGDPDGDGIHRHTWPNTAAIDPLCDRVLPDHRHVHGDVFDDADHHRRCLPAGHIDGV